MAPGRFLFACPTSVLDQGNGAAHSVRTLLGALAARGHEAAALQATVFDSPSGGQDLLKSLNGADRSKVFRLRRAGVEHYIVPTEHVHRGRMSADEAERFLDTFRLLVEQRRPDILLTWGGRVLERMLRAEARRKGIPVVFYLANPSYRHDQTFADIDLVVTDTRATAALYKDRLGIDPRAIGKLIDPADCTVASRRPRFITFVNPLPEKGSAFVAALARCARNALPEAQFLVVESRGSWSGMIHDLGLDPREFSNVYTSPACADMRVVYEQTSVLLVPSLWHESGPRVVVEAMMNGIPVIASDSGGIPENLGASGFTFAMPESVTSNWHKLPPDDAVTPWLDVLTRLVRDDAFYADESRKVLEASARHAVEPAVARFLELVTPLADRTAA